MLGCKGVADDCVVAAVGAGVVWVAGNRTVGDVGLLAALLVPIGLPGLGRRGAGLPGPPMLVMGVKRSFGWLVLWDDWR